MTPGDFKAIGAMAPGDSQNVIELPFGVVGVEADDPRPGWAITIRRGRQVWRPRYHALLSVAHREADGLAAAHGWRRVA